jgi:GT2 family glycosyltransferase/glycosyltransferase involved in cell wall biosynthesis
LDQALPLSVVIATYNRSKWLKIVLEGFCKQTLPQDRFEIILVDDCSTEDLSSLVEDFTARLPLKYLRQEVNSGLGAARNRGFSAARGDIILFFDDDDRPDERVLEEHLATHTKHPADNVAVLGLTVWDPELEMTPVMYHVTEVGKQYLSYPDIAPDTPLPFHYFWGGRSSIKRAMLEKENFDPGFNLQALEDIELAWRLRKYDLTVYFNPNSIQYAMRPLDTKSFCERWFRQGQAMAQFMERHASPELERHLGLVGAEERFASLEGLIPALESHIATLEPLDSDHRRSLVVDAASRRWNADDFLHFCYRNVFDAWRLKGYVEARQTVAPEPASEGPQPRGSILFLAPELPLFDRSSGGFRLYQIVKMAKGAGHEVTFIAREPGAVRDWQPYADALEALGVEVHPYDPDKVFDTWGKSIDQPRIDLRELFQRKRFDVAYCYFFEIADLYREEIRELSPETRFVVDSVDLHYLRELRHGTLLGDEKLIEKAANTRKRELASYAAADEVITVTETDRAALLAADPGLNVRVIPNIHPSVGSGKRWEDRRDIVFVGGFRHRPNVDAMILFYHDVWPQVIARLPDARLIIVGSDPPESILNLAGDRVVVTGHVPDTAEYLDACRISVAPLMYGAGMKGKVGEALAAGLPVVGTTIACEGMGLTDGEDVLVADSPSHMADAIVSLYEDENLWHKLSESGRGLVRDRYSPEAIKSNVLDVLKPRSGYREETVTGKEPPAFKASIVIPVWNRVEFTQKCVEALAGSIPEEFPYEVVIIDNGSTDGTSDFLATLGGDVQVIRNAKNLGFAKACNQGARAARGEWIVFLNNDTEPKAGWLEEMIGLGQSLDRVGIVGAKLLYPDGTIQHAGVAFTGRAEGKFIIHGDHFDKDVFIDLLPYHVFRKMPADAPYVNMVRDFQVVTGACLAIRKDTFEEIGGFDETYVNGFEDVDLCLKVLKKDRRVVYCPTAVVTHHESKSEGRHDHDLSNARVFHERWRDFIVPDDERFYREAGFVPEQPQDRMTVWKYDETLALGEAAMAEGKWPEALSAFETFLTRQPDHSGARIKAAVLRERTAKTATV